ncbi:GNAT family N-acetyltransferase [Bacillus atrophaeus]|uniref:GNAT family N-acetyltransferase n=1 Tax=Bacillus atrophaeus TaxID=1452 RepID=UPI001BA7A239|nr:GNAT family N-acetyltransferase [Bacillus atrophaeus]MCY8520122.1 GNAT family N-acetyltransferase [Bacillus atrophaeus]MCY8526856.1 GNAT family N-acetyltransferase [Bacillus atrophaeus]MCY8959165.1 GNAT family N-acetyltransferase [Bacillus atrophaeus]MCY8964740.1 GNAT family N-acetyltransferase [Bacillus atrophaeus]MCY9436521.1 GNAT family N-acetyltransferase [Bacillus atrophaeus]
MILVNEISAEDTYEIRHMILRPHQTIEQCKYEQDKEEGSFHLGAFFDGTLISIASFYRQDHPLIEASPSYQMRGMATLPGYRKQRAGSTLVTRAEQKLADMGAKTVWCNARCHVQGYYEKLGWKDTGDPFDLPGIGPHIVMYKKLK